MEAIFEQAIAPDYKETLHKATSFRDIQNLFANFFNISMPQDPEAYKSDGSDYGLKISGMKTREKLNEQCKEILARVKQPEDLTPEDRAVLLQYSGRGGTSYNNQWEYYTPTHVAQGVWEAMKANGFENGNVLEPSCGAGVFLGTKPSGVIMTANDLDEIGSGVARLLNPLDKVSHQAFEELVLATEDDTFDSCIGNVPFGKARGDFQHTDPAYKNEKLPQAYFILRILDKIKPGGLACLIVPTDVINDKNGAWKRRRREISKKAEFLGAHKLPSGTFGGKGGQGTDTVVDVIVFRKHGRQLLEKLRNDEIPLKTLKDANVYWEEFIQGKYWNGEGRPFIMGKFVPRDPNKFRDVDRVEGKIDDATLKQNLARKFHSRIKWDILNEAEPVIRNYLDGDQRFINGEPFEYQGGTWQKVAVKNATTPITQEKYGAQSMEELKAMLSELPGALRQTCAQAFATYNETPHLMTAQQKDAVSFAMAQERPEVREQVYRGTILGSILAKMNVDEQAGEDVSLRRKALQEIIVAEMQKYGHPANNPNFTLLGQSSRAFGVFMNSVDTNGKFSDLLSGTLDKKDATGYKEDNPADIVLWLSKQNGDQVEFEDVKKLYKGAAPLENLADLAEFDDLAITPAGMLEPITNYCSGDVVTKMAELAKVMATVEDDRLKAKFQKQIDHMNALIKRVPAEDITFGLQHKWYSKQYLVDFLRDKGYPDATFGEWRDEEEEGYDGTFQIRRKFVEDLDAPDGQFKLHGPHSGKLKEFPGQFEKYLNGENVTSSKSELKAEYQNTIRLLEDEFDAWMKQHPHIDDLAEQYTMKFNSFVQPEYSTDPLDIDDIISGTIRPHSYQNAEVRRLSEQGSGICGFGTGLGKSFTALAMAGYNFKHGRAKRTCVIVPSAVLENWYHEANTFYSEKYMRSNVFFVGLEPKLDKEGTVMRKPILDENGQPKLDQNGKPQMQDIVRFAKSKKDIYKAMWKIPQSNYSLVVMTKEKFKSIPVRPETMKGYTDEMVKRHLLSEKDAQDAVENGKKKKGKSYSEDVHLNALKGQYSNQGGEKNDALPYLEDMGFDSIITDESHFFKNSLSRGEKTGNIVGVPSPAPSDIAIDMSIKSDWIRRKNNGRGVYGLTATPVTNSPIEIFNMLSLVAPKEDFEKMGIRTVDDFVRQFGNIEQRDRANVANEIIKGVDTLTGFKNLQGLRNLFNKYVNIKTVDDVDDEIHVPNAVEKEEEVDITTEQHDTYIGLRAEARVAANDPYSKDHRSIFSIMRDMDRCTTDMDLFKRQISFVFSNIHKATMQKLLGKLPRTFTAEEKDEFTDAKVKVTYNYEPKIIPDGDVFTLLVHEQHEEAVLKALKDANISENEINHPISPKYAKLIERLKSHLDNGGKQIVFTEEKSQHKKLKRILVHNLPVEESQIGIINAENAAGDKLDKISKAYNRGEIKIVIANKKAEVGVNLQKGTTAIHHLTLPWTPASINQRNGRGVRQGNKVDSVDIYYYSGKGTFDTYRKQLLQSKSNWIGQLLNGRESTATNADIEAQEEMAAMVAGTLDEYRAKKAQAEKEKQDRVKTQYFNRLRILASIQLALDMMDMKRNDAKEKAEFEISMQKSRISNYEKMNKSETTVKKAKETLRKLEEKLAHLDEKFDAQQSKYEAQRKQNIGMLKTAAKKGELPFDESLIDHPDRCLISKNGQIYIIGEFLEDKESGEIFQITDIRQDDKVLVLANLGGQYQGTMPVDKADSTSTKVSYSASELVVKKLSSGAVRYSYLPASGITKQQFLENIPTMVLDTNKGAIARQKDGKLTVVQRMKQLEEGLVYEWPEPSNEDFRKNALKLALEAGRGRNYNPYDNMFSELFGQNYMEQAAEYSNKATPVEINQLIQAAFDDCYNTTVQSLGDSFVQNISLGYGWESFAAQVCSKAKRDAALKGFDNLDDVRTAITSFMEGKRTEFAQKAAEQQKQNEEDSSISEHKVIPQGIQQKFKELGMEIRFNTDVAKLGPKRGLAKYYGPYERLFIKDDAGIGGKLYYAKDRIKELFGAQFTKKWQERFGAWWHVPASTDLNQLYDVIVG